jgi:hypothetical protein
VVRRLLPHGGVGRLHGIVLAFVASGCSDVLGFEELSDAQPCFRDTFDDGSIDKFWNTFGDVAERGGRVQLALPSGTAANLVLVSTEPHDLTGGSITIDVARSVNQAGGAQNLLAAIVDAEHYLLFTASNGKLAFGSVTPQGGTGGDVAFDPRVDSWRIRHDDSDDTIHFETAIAAEWSSRLSFPAPFPVDNTFVQIEADSFEQELIPAPANPGMAEFDNFGLSAPVCR